MKPIDNDSTLCGNGALPNNKDRFGTRDECLRQRIAVGTKAKYIRDGGYQRVHLSYECKGLV